ncbi:MAG: hypothetical protein IPH49_14705 [Ignavibacteria bacterium]|nr:hypothetical protein [Ignavibacteria bacterium]
MAALVLSGVVYAFLQRGKGTSFRARIATARVRLYEQRWRLSLALLPLSSVEDGCSFNTKVLNTYTSSDETERWQVL